MLATISDMPPAHASSDRHYNSLEFSADGERLLLDVFGPEGTRAMVEVWLDPEPQFRIVEHDCRYRLGPASYMPDGDIVFALSPTPAIEPPLTILMRADAESGTADMLTELPSNNYVQDLAVSTDGESVYVAQVEMIGVVSSAAISRYNMTKQELEVAFDGFEESRIEFFSFAGIDGPTVSFAATKDFDDLTRDEVGQLSRTVFAMTEEAFLLFETTNDPDVAVLSRHYPALRAVLKDDTDPDGLSLSLIYYLGFSIRSDFGETYAMVDISDAGSITPPVMYRIEDGTLHPLFEPGFDSERFAVSAAGDRVALIHRTESGAPTITLFEQSDGAWTSRSLQPALDAITSLDCVE